MFTDKLAKPGDDSKKQVDRQGLQLLTWIKIPSKNGSDTVLALDLLKHAIADSPPTFEVASKSRLDASVEREFRWIVDAGLGPLMHHATRERADAVPPSWRDMLLASDLTAQVWHGNFVDTAVDVIDACRGAGIPVTLLKGISISEQYYPSGHMRPMGDIDVLVPAGAYESVESLLLGRGYVRKPDYQVSPGAAHGIPLMHAGLGVWVEVHTGLFDGVGVGETFGLAQVGAQTIESEFYAQPVGRLSDELQLLYIAHSCFQDIAKYNVEIQPSGLMPLFDAVSLLRSRAASVDWELLLRLGGDGLACASLYTMLSYLARVGMGSGVGEFASRLSARQRIVGAIQLRVMHAVLDRYLFGGRKWSLPVPVPVPGRYKPGYQLGKRLRRLAVPAPAEVR